MGEPVRSVEQRLHGDVQGSDPIIIVWHQPVLLWQVPQSGTGKDGFRRSPATCRLRSVFLKNGPASPIRGDRSIVCVEG